MERRATLQNILFERLRKPKPYFALQLRTTHIMASIRYSNLAMWTVFTFCMSGCCAIECFSRSGDFNATSTAISCPGFTYCYLRNREKYSDQYRSSWIISYRYADSVMFAGCTSDSNFCNNGYYPYDYCVLCSTDYCNNMTSPRNCYFRSISMSGSTVNLTDNGTAVSCPGYPFCYMFTQTQEYSRHLLFFAGCTFSRRTCGEMNEDVRSVVPCVTCGTDYCNSLTPSSISCLHYHYSLVANVSCGTRFSTCYLFSSGSYLFGGCGDCSARPDTCQLCSTNYCNTVSPSNISCYARSQPQTPYTGPGSVISCHTGITTCRSHTDSQNIYADCGGCNNTAVGSCVTCSSNLCNTHLPSSISCYSRTFNYGYQFNNGTMEQCSTGIYTCYTYRNASSYYPYEEYAGCGVCNASVPSTFSCSMCNSSGCNYAVPYFRSTSTQPGGISQVPMSSSSTTASSTNDQSGNSGKCQKSGMKCYYSFGETDYKKREKVTCSSSSCFEFSFGLSIHNYFYAGCGNCSALGSFFTGCRTCYDDYCNSAWAMGAGQLTLITVIVCGFIIVLVSKVSV